MFDEFHEGGGVLGIHCVCHRFALVVSDAIKSAVLLSGGQYPNYYPTFYRIFTATSAKADIEKNILRAL